MQTHSGQCEKELTELSDIFCSALLLLLLLSQTTAAGQVVFLKAATTAASAASHHFLQVDGHHLSCSCFEVTDQGEKRKLKGQLKEEAQERKGIRLFTSLMHHFLIIAVVIVVVVTHRYNAKNILTGQH